MKRWEQASRSAEQEQDALTTAKAEGGYEQAKPQYSQTVKPNFPRYAGREDQPAYGSLIENGEGDNARNDQRHYK
jgi:hypothetical protein